MSETAVKPSFLARLMRGLLLLTVPPVALAAGLYFYVSGGRYVVTENAYVKANVIAISSNVPGRVVWVGVEDNSAVTKGQPLFQIDPVPFEIALARAEAEMAQVVTEVRALKAELKEASVALDRANEDVRFLELQFERQSQLQARGVAAKEKYDTARHDLAAGRQQVRMIEQRIARVLASLDGHADIAPERHPRYLGAKSTKDRAALDLGDTLVASPADGVTSNMKLQPGEYVLAGTPTFSVIESTPLWVEANLKETELTHVRERQSARVVVDAYPDVVWPASVKRIAPATGAEFALLPPQNATGNWVKVVQRVPVEIQVTPPPDAPPLRAGMTVTVTIDTGFERDVGTLVREAMAWTGRHR